MLDAFLSFTQWYHGGQEIKHALEASDKMQILFMCQFLQLRLDALCYAIAHSSEADNNSIKTSTVK